MVIGAALGDACMVRSCDRVICMREDDLSLELADRHRDADADQIRTWRNDPVTLSMSFHRAPKEPEAFRVEYRATYFADDAPPAVFVCRGSERFAFLRFRPAQDPRGVTAPFCDISINVAPAARGAGLGTRALRFVDEFLRARGIVGIVAEIRTENRASIRSFENAGYELVNTVTKHIPDTGETCSIFVYRKMLAG